MTIEHEHSGFLSRWSRRKVRVREGVAPPEPVAPVPLPAPNRPSAAACEPATAPDAPPAPPAPTLADVAALDHHSDYTRFVAPGVDSGVKNAALKKLFTDPHFNVMDGLDTYIDDYGIPDPLPAGMLRQMAQSQFLGLFADEPAAGSAAAAQDAALAAPALLPLAQATPDEDAALRLQPHDAAGPPGTGTGPGADAGRQC
jgi:hypothetical protein